MILFANIATAMSNVIVSLKSKGMNPLVLSSFSLGTGGLILYLFSLPIEGTVQAGKPLVYWLDTCLVKFYVSLCVFIMV